MSDKTNHGAEMIARLIKSYEEVALREHWLALDETRPEAQRARSHDAADRATARLLELEQELRG